METGDLFKTRNSLRVSSSSAWRNNGVEVFSRSSRDEDDEEALKWAALERLPTYDLLRIGILTTSRGEATEINIDNLGQQERKELIERLQIEDDNEIFLLKLRARIDKVGIKLPTIEVRYEHLNVEAEAYVGSRALPTFLNFNANILEGRCWSDQQRHCSWMRYQLGWTVLPLFKSLFRSSTTFTFLMEQRSSRSSSQHRKLTTFLMTLFSSPMAKLCTRDPVNKFLTFSHSWALNVQKGKACLTSCKR